MRLTGRKDVTSLSRSSGAPDAPQADWIKPQPFPATGAVLYYGGSLGSLHSVLTMGGVLAALFCQLLTLLSGF
jgi:hypothetical protein